MILRLIPVNLVPIVVLIALIGASLMRPGPVLAASGTLSMETALHDSPDPAGPVIALLPEGTVVSIDGPPVDGFYPVTASDRSGWMRGETLQVEKDLAVSDATVDTPLDETDETVPAEASADLDPTTDPAIATTVRPATAPAADTLAATEASPPAADPASGDETGPIVEPIPADKMAAVNEPISVDSAAAAPAPELESAVTPVPVAPDSESAASDSAPTPSDVAAEPSIDPNVTPISVEEVAPVGLASVTVDAPIRTGPGPSFELIITAPMGSAVQQTGHVIDGYVTVQYAEATGWVALEHLGAPGSVVEETPLPETTAPVKTSLVELPPAETPPAETVPAERPLIDAAPAEPQPTETPPTETVSTETPPAETLPAETAPTEAA